MKRYLKKAAFAAIAMACLFGSAVTSLDAQTAPVQPPATPPAAKTAGQVFKNLQVLKDIPQEQLFPTMQFVATSLNVQCEFCHVHEAFDKDDKKTKQTARKMMEMEIAINKSHFDGHLDVTCFTCHRGTSSPVGIPVITDEGPAPLAPAPKPGETPALPTVDQIQEKYVQALGGAAALEKSTSRVEKGTLSLFGRSVPPAMNGRSFPLEIYAKAAGQAFLHGSPPDR